MRKLCRFIPLMGFVCLIAACAQFESGTQKRIYNPSLTESSSQQQQSPNPQPSQNFAQTQILDFLPENFAQTLSDKERSEAATAQFYALQYGRVGAFREWSGDNAINGEVSVGPYIKVNNLDCREFTHTIIVDKVRSSKKGTSCREQNGQWRVVDSLMS